MKKEIDNSTLLLKHSSAELKQKNKIIAEFKLIKNSEKVHKEEIQKMEKKNQ